MKENPDKIHQRGRRRRSRAQVLVLLSCANAASASDEQALPHTWSSDFAEAELMYSDMVPRWRAAFGEQRGELAEDYYVHLRMAAEIQILEDRQQTLAARLDEVKKALAEEMKRKAEVDGVIAELDISVEQTTEATLQMIDDLHRSLQGTRGSRPVREALDAWSTAHRFFAWDLYLAGGPDARAPLRRELETAAASLSLAAAEQLSTLLRKASDEEYARRRRWTYLRAAAAVDPRPLEAERDRLVDALVEPTRRIQDLRGRLSDIASSEMTKDELSLLSDSAELHDQYMSLEARLEAAGLTDAANVLDQTHISRETWCRLFVHGGISSLMAQGEGSAERLRTAAATYNGPCQDYAAEQFDVATIHSAWSAAMFLESQEEPAWLLLDEGAGRWSIDGTFVEGPGPTRFRLQPGTHRIELYAEGGMDALLEDFKQGDLIGVRAQDSQIQLDVLLPSDETWEIPVRREVFTVEGSTEIAPEPDWRIATGPTALAFDGRFHLGGSAIVQRRVAQWNPLDLSVGLGLDWLGGVNAYAYGPGSTASILRLRAPIQARMPPAANRPLVVLSPGIILPFQAITVDASAGLDLRLDERLSLQVELGSTTSFWRQGATWLEPTGSLAISRWF